MAVSQGSIVTRAIPSKGQFFDVLGRYISVVFES